MVWRLMRAKYGDGPNWMIWIDAVSAVTPGEHRSLDWRWALVLYFARGERMGRKAPQQSIRCMRMQCNAMQFTRQRTGQLLNEVEVERLRRLCKQAASFVIRVLPAT